MHRLALILVLLACSAPPAAAEYPDRAVTMIVGYPAGGMVDIVGRPLAEGMKKKFAKGIAIVNRPGAGGSIGVAETVQSKPDGYTIILTPLSPLVIQPQMSDLPYRTPDDYEPIVNVVAFYPLLAVRADAPWRTVQEFIAAAKARPDTLKVGFPGQGTSSHLNLEELARLAKFSVTRVPFAGWAESSVALLGSHVDAIVAQPGEVKPLADAKKMRALAVFQPTRHPYFADAPAVKELGYDIANGIWFLLLAPKGTPTAAVRTIHDAAKAVMEDRAFVELIKARGIDLDYRAGDQLRADLWREYKAHTAILKRLDMLKK